MEHMYWTCTHNISSYHCDQSAGGLVVEILYKTFTMTHATLLSSVSTYVSGSVPVRSRSDSLTRLIAE